MVTNPQGQIALKWVLPRNPQTVVIDGTDRYYVFAPKLHIFLAWIEPEDAPRLLTKKAKLCNCKNGTYKIAFEAASLLDVQLWLTGGRNDLPEGYKEN